MRRGGSSRGRVRAARPSAQSRRRSGHRRVPSIIDSRRAMFSLGRCVERVRANLPEARTLLLYRREDFIDRGWPKAMERRAAQLAEQSRRELRAFTRRLTGRSDQQAVRTLAYALLEAPLAAVRRHIDANEVPPSYIHPLVPATYRAVVRLVAWSESAVRSLRASPVAPVRLTGGSSSHVTTS